MYCYDAGTGKLLWTGDVPNQPGSDSSPRVQPDTGYAAPTMAVDGKRAFAFFPTGDLACFSSIVTPEGSYPGQRLWALSLGKLDNMYGYATSLTLYRDRLIVQLDQGASADASDPGSGKSFIMAFDTGTGRLVWRTKRPIPNSWGTPIVISAGSRDELVTVGSPLVIAYDPGTGAELWEAEGVSGDIAPSPTFGNGLVFACEQGSTLIAIRPGGSGNVTKTRIAWTFEDNLPDIVSPLAAGNLLFLVTTDGTVTCLDAGKGAKLWEHAFDGAFKSSPSLVGDRVYLVDQNGITHFFAAARTFKDLGSCALGEHVTSTPAFVGGHIFIRGKQHLFCLGTKP